MISTISIGVPAAPSDQLLTDRQFTNALPRRGKDRVAQRGNDWWQRRLAYAGGIVVGDAPVHFNLWRLCHAQQLVLVQVRLLRAAVFKVLSLVARDPLNLHYLDAQPSLGHKARWRDARIAGLVDADWEARIATFPKDRRALFGLQLFPEAAIDYWIEDLALVDHETMLIECARLLTDAGFQIVVKDHPLQFGFRQTHLLDALRALPNVVVVPYEVSGNAMLSLCGVSLTATGTLGLQAALLGNISVVGEAYYVTEDDFVVIGTWDDLGNLPRKLMDRHPPSALPDRQARIIENLLRGSFDADFFSFKSFNPARPNPAAAELGRRLGERIRALGPEGEDWHGHFMLAEAGRHPGSPLN